MSSPIQPDLSGKVAIVTGGGRGIGAAMAIALGTAGAKIAIGDINIDQMERVRQSIEAAGGEALSIPTDIANKFQCVHLIESTREQWGRLDILVNAGAVAPSIPILKLDELDFVRTLDVTLKGTFFMSQLCGRVMADQFEAGEAGGAIVNIGSRVGLKSGEAGQAAYGTAKSAVIGFTRVSAIEFKPFGTRVNAVIPAEPNISRYDIDNRSEQAALSRLASFALPFCRSQTSETIDADRVIQFQPDGGSRIE